MDTDPAATPGAANAEGDETGQSESLESGDKGDILLLQADVSNKLRELRTAVDSVIDVSTLDAAELRVEVHRARQRADEAELALEQHRVVHGHTVRELRLQHARMTAQVFRELEQVRMDKGSAEIELHNFQERDTELMDHYEKDAAHIAQMHQSLSKAGGNTEEGAAIIEEELRSLREERDVLRQELTRAHADNEQVRVMREQLEEAREQKRDALVEKNQLESEMAEMLETIKRLEKERGDRIAQFMCDGAGLAHELQEKGRTLQVCQAELSTLRTRMGECAKAHAEERAAHHAEMERLRGVVKSNTDTVEDIRTAYEATKADLRARTQAIDDAEARARALEGALAEERAAVKRMRSGAHAAADERVRAANEAAATLREECRDARASAKQATEQAHEWRERCAHLEREIAAEKERAHEALQEWSTWSEAELQGAREMVRVVDLQSALRESDLRVSELQRGAAHDAEALRTMEAQMRVAQDDNARAQTVATQLRTQLEQVEEQLLAEHECTARLGRELADKEREFMETSIKQEQLIGNLQRRVTSERRRSVTLGEQAEERMADRVTELEAALRALQEKHETVAAQRDTAATALDTLRKELAKVDRDEAERASPKPRSSLQVLFFVLLGMGALYILLRAIAVSLFARTVPPPV